MANNASSQPTAGNEETPFERNPGQGGRAIRYSSIERALLSLSKTDLHVLQFCTAETRMTQVSVGAMVAITGILAFISGFFAINSSMYGRDNSLAAIVIPSIVAALYASAIMIFDREVVAADKGDRKAAWARAALAVFIGFVISFPIELKLFDDAIQNRILDQAQEKNRPQRAVLTELRTDLQRKHKEAREEVLTSYRQEVEVAQREVGRAKMEWDREAERVACRAICEKRKLEFAQAREGLSAKQRDLREKEGNIDAELDRRFAPDATRVADLEAAISSGIAERTAKSRDFITRADVLHELTQESPAALIVSWVLRLFFVALEVFPVLIKIFLPYNEYRAYLQSRRAILVNKLHAIANHLNNRVTNDPESAMTRGAEYTDFMELSMEDRQVDLVGREADGTNPRREGAAPA